MHVCRFLFVFISICLFISLRLMSAGLSVFLLICLSVCMYVCQSSVCLPVMSAYVYTSFPLYVLSCAWSCAHLFQSVCGSLR